MLAKQRTHREPGKDVINNKKINNAILHEAQLKETSIFNTSNNFLTLELPGGVETIAFTLPLFGCVLSLSCDGGCLTTILISFLSSSFTVDESAAFERSKVVNRSTSDL